MCSFLSCPLFFWLKPYSIHKFSYLSEKPTWDYSYSQIPRFFKTVHLPLTNTPSSLCSTSIIRFFCILKIGQLNICPFHFLDFLEIIVEIDEPNALASNTADISKCRCCFSWMWKLPRLFKIGRLKFLFCVNQCDPSWLVDWIELCGLVWYFLYPYYTDEYKTRR